jgi:hypothetical protein
MALSAVYWDTCQSFSARVINVIVRGEKALGLQRVQLPHGGLEPKTLIPSTILLVPLDTTARSAATQNLRNRRMTKRDALLLKSAPRAEQSLVTKMPANRT